MLQGGLHEWAPAQVCADGTIDVSTAKVLKNDELCVLIVLNNTTISGLQGVEVQFDPPRNLQASYAGEPSPQVQGNRILINSLPGRSRAFVVARLGFLDMAPSMQLRGQVSYKSEGGLQSSVSFQTIIEVQDLLRPAPLSTDEFGAKWGSFGDGKRIWISPTSCKTPQDYSNRVKNLMCINPVQTIGTEVISAGQIMGGGTLILIHAALDPAKNGVNITVNSSQGALSDMVCRACQATFK